MSISRVGAPGSTPQIALETGEIVTLDVEISQSNVSLSQLKEYERDASINLVGRHDSRGIDVLTSLLGVSLTAGSVAWSGDPVPKMRALQKKFLEHGLKQEGEPRRRALAAITVVEKSIKGRLRLHQLHMSDLQLASVREESKS